MRNATWMLRALLCAGSLCVFTPCFAGRPINNGNGIINQGAVGGISIDAKGVLQNLSVDNRKELRAVREKALAGAAGEMEHESKLRFVSLAKLDAAIHVSVANKQPLPEAVMFLAGLQRIEYVFVDVEHHDIILAGPGEGWKVNEQGAVVGVKSGRPVLQLDDLVTALRSAESARQASISCSIDPTAEGIGRVRAILAKQKDIGADPKATIAGIEQALGPQNITVTGVPVTSRFAHLLVAADYRMKRLGMKMEEPPVTGLPSYLDLASAGPTGIGNAFPRWWLVPNYEAVIRDPAGLSWKFSGGVKCMAAEDFFAGNQKTQTAKASPAAQKWADNMTKKYDELAKKETVFAELNGCIDLAIVGTLIAKENLLSKADLKLTALSDPKEFAVQELAAAKTIDTHATFVKKGSNWLISASGGVQIQPWEIVSQAKQDEQITSARKAAPAGKNDAWWWD